MLKNPFKRKRKLTFEIAPHAGILPIRLNMSADEILQTMQALGQERTLIRDNVSIFKNLGLEPPKGISETHFYIENSMQIEFDNDDRATFIGIMPHSDIRVNILSIDVFNIPAKDCFKGIVKAYGIEGISYCENEVLFPKQILTLWNADPQHELSGQRFPVWGQIGVGTKTYLENSS